jgi:pseudaminic acid biosynthesis-associated methylase
MTIYSTPQEEFWAGDFGSEYITRNQDDRLLAANVSFFSRVLQRTGQIRSCVELGANIGMNLRALRTLVPAVQARAVEINGDAVQLIGDENVTAGSLLDCEVEPADLAFTKGVLIHINQEALPIAYDRLYAASNRFILVAEYYNPIPVAISYRGHDDRLFKRDFAGEMMDRFSDLSLIDYGFVYRRDPNFPQDDIHWFLMEKLR